MTLSQELYLKEKLAIKLLPYTYKGSIENHFCLITKNPFKEGDEIIQCPLCFSLYHKKYLLDWLLRKNSCPVCGKKFFNF